MKKAVSAGDLGKILAIKTTTRDSPKPQYEFLKAAGNVIISYSYFTKRNMFLHTYSQTQCITDYIELGLFVWPRDYRVQSLCLYQNVILVL